MFSFICRVGLIQGHQNSTEVQFEDCWSEYKSKTKASAFQLDTEPNQAMFQTAAEAYIMNGVWLHLR